jgi:transposase-like protein
VAKREYTEEFRTEALALYQQVGASEAARRLHMPAPTLTSWARRAGVQSDAGPTTRAAIEQAKLTNEQRRERIITKLYEQAERLIDRMHEPQTDYKGQQAREVRFDEAQADAVKNLGAAVKDLLDRAELLSGQATSRTESVGANEFKSYLEGHWDAYQRQGTGASKR